MARLFLTDAANRQKMPVFQSGSQVTFGGHPSAVVRLVDPRIDPRDARPATPGGPPTPTVPSHIATVVVGKEVVEVCHEPPSNRPHGLFVVPEGQRSRHVDYGCSVLIVGRGRIVIRDSPNLPRQVCWPDFVFGYAAAEARALKGPAHPAADRPAGMTGKARSVEFQLSPVWLNYATPLALPWLTGQPELWMSVKEVAAMWHKTENAVDEAMRKLRDAMAETDPPLWDRVDDGRAGANQAAAGVLARLGLITVDDLEELNVLGHRNLGEPARPCQRPRRRHTRLPDDR